MENAWPGKTDELYKYQTEDVGPFLDLVGWEGMSSPCSSVVLLLVPDRPPSMPGRKIHSRAVRSRLVLRANWGGCEDLQSTERCVWGVWGNWVPRFPQTKDEEVGPLVAAFHSGNPKTE